MIKLHRTAHILKNQSKKLQWEINWFMGEGYYPPWLRSAKYTHTRN
jgi:hypothetical protein